MESSHHQLGIFSYNSLSCSSLSLNNLDKPAGPEPQKLDDTILENASFEVIKLKAGPLKQSEGKNREEVTPTLSKKLLRNIDCLEANKFIIRTPKKGILVQKRTLQQSESAYFEKRIPKKVSIDTATPSSADKGAKESLLRRESKSNHNQMIDNNKLKSPLEPEDLKDAKSPKKVTFLVSDRNCLAAKTPMDNVEIIPKPLRKNVNSQLAEIVTSTSTPSKKFDELRISKTMTGFFVNQNFSSPKTAIGIFPKTSHVMKPGQLPFETPTSSQKSLLLKQKSETQSIFQKEVNETLNSKISNNLKSLSFSATAKPGTSWITPSPPLNLDKISLSRITKKQGPLSHRTESTRVRLNINDLK